MRIKLIIEYDGSGFCGWQKQQNCCDTSISIQECIEVAIRKSFGDNESVELFCAGRTDAGVHAVNQVAHFDVHNCVVYDRWVGSNIYKLPKAINYHLQTDRIAIKDAALVGDDFHARFSAQMRRYQYLVYNSNTDTVFAKNRMWHVRCALDIDAMKRAALYLMGKHDFTSFCSSQCEDKNKVRTISKITIGVCNNVNYVANNSFKGDIISVDIFAKSFLHNQVRIIVGTLIDVGLQKLNPEYMRTIIDAKNRRYARRTAPPYGLYFMDVQY